MPNWKKVIVSGSDASLNSLIVTAGITGSLFGTASWSNNASTSSYSLNAITASYVLPLVQNVSITGSLSNGSNTNASGSYSHAEGAATIANGQGSHAEGTGVVAGGEYSHAEGYYTQANGSGSHAEGQSTIASGDGSHAEGFNTTASGNSSHAEGFSTIASIDGSHAEGMGTISSGNSSHSEGNSTIASGSYSHAEGEFTITYGASSHAEGYGTVTSGSYQHVQGQWNLSSSAQSAFIIGNGTSNTNRSNLVFTSGSTFQITGSAIITGSLIVTGSSNFSGSLTISGNTIMTGSLTALNLTASFGYVSASFLDITGKQTVRGFTQYIPTSDVVPIATPGGYIYSSGSQGDLYFAQTNGVANNVVRLRWIEGNMYSGLLHGGLISTQSSTTYQVSSGSGILVTMNTSIATEPYPTIQYLNWNALSASIDPLSGSYDQSFVSINSSTAIEVQGTPYMDGDYDSKITLGVVVHQNRSTINAVQTFPNVAYGLKQRNSDFFRAFGPLKISGYALAQSASSAGGLTLSGGTAWVDGRNYTINPSSPSYIVEATGLDTSKIYRYRQSGSGWVYDTNAGAGYTDIDPTQYSLSGVLTSVPTNDWTIQRIFYFPNSGTKAFYIYYGNDTYANKDTAVAALTTEPFIEAPNTAANAIFVGYILARYDADFNTAASYEFRAAGLYRASGAGGGGGGTGGTTLPGGSDTQIQYNNNGVFNGVPTLTYNGTGLSATGSFTGSFTGISSYALNSATASYVNTAQSASYVNDLYQDVHLNGALMLHPTEDPGNVPNHAHLFVSSSGDNTEFNLHYRNNGNMWETHWLEERADTGIVWGGVTTYSGSTIYITPGAGLIINHNAKTGSHGDTAPTYVNFGPITASATYLETSQVTYLLINTDGTLLQQTSPFTPQQYNEKLPLGYVFSFTTSSISSFADARSTTYGQDDQQSQFIKAFGPLKLNGYDIATQSGSLNLSVASGTTYRYGGFYAQSPDNPSLYNSSNIATASFVRIYKDPAVLGGFKAATNAGVPYTAIDPTKWDNGTGTLQTVSASQWSIQRIYQGSVNNLSYAYYGPAVYDSLNSAVQAISTEAFEESLTSIVALPFIGYVIAKGDTTNLGDTTNNKILQAGLFRNTAGSSGGGGAATTVLSDISDVTLTSPVTGQSLVYDAGVWINAIPTSASYSQTASYVTPLVQDVQITGSLAVTETFTGTGGNTIYTDTLIQASLIYLANMC